MFRNLRTATLISQRTIKNFGHKREPVPLVTTLWHGLLTFTFIGFTIEWDRIKKYLFGENENFVQDTTDPIGRM